MQFDIIIGMVIIMGGAFLAAKDAPSQQCIDHDKDTSYEPVKKKIKFSSLMMSNEIHEIDYNVTKPFLLELECTEGNETHAHAKEKLLVDVESKVSFSKYPLVRNWPHLVLDSNKLSLFDLDKSDYIFSASLPPACQELYANVARG